MMLLVRKDTSCGMITRPVMVLGFKDSAGLALDACSSLLLFGALSPTHLGVVVIRDWPAQS